MSKKIVIVLVILVLIFSLGLIAKKVGIVKIGQPEKEIAQEKPLSEFEEETPSKLSLEEFAECLKEKGAKFYGTFWCGWCNRQKELFGEAAKYLPYVECSDKETNQITSECQKAQITGFPTWEINGAKSPGFKSLEELAELSGCPLNK